MNLNLLAAAKLWLTVWRPKSMVRPRSKPA